MEISQTLTANSLPIPMPAIFNLHQDILLHIFQLNTHRDIETEHCTLDDDPEPFCPLNIARYTSQVCRPWRRIILKSGTIWGSIIDMTIFESCSKKWAKTVLKRARTAPLAIYGRIGYPQRQNRHFFKSLLTKQWHRVRGIDLILYEPDDEPYFDSEMWDVFFRKPAPMLDVFIFEGDQGGGATVPADNRGPMFANDAPRLRRFHCTDLAVVEYNTAWITKLKSLTLIRPSNTLDALNILRTTVSLESLVIKDYTQLSDVPGLEDWTTQIHLPHLQRLEIRAKADMCDIYLRSIVGPPGCSLVFLTVDHASTFSPIRFIPFVDTLASYMKMFIINRQPYGLYISLEGLHIEIEPTERASSGVYFAHPAFEVVFGNSIHPLLPAGIECTPIHHRLISNLSSIPLECINSFTYLAKDNLSTLSTREDDADFLRLITGLSSVTRLCIRRHTLKLLTDARLGSDIVFPLLDTLELTQEPFGRIHRFSQELIFFLNHRKAAGVPLTTLHLGEYWRIKDDFDWSFLDLFQGLKVTYVEP